MLIDRLRQAPGTRRRRGRGTGGLEYGGLAVAAVLAVGVLGSLDPAAAAGHPRSGACGRFGSGCGTEAVLSETRLGRTAQHEYEDAYDDAVAKARRARSELGLPALDDETARRAGERAGRERVEQAFANGEVVSSLDGDTYAENYGEAWDDAHNCLLRIFC